MKTTVIRIQCTHEGDGWYAISSPDVPRLDGHISCRTVEECITAAQRWTDALYRAYIRRGDPLPEALLNAGSVSPPSELTIVVNLGVPPLDEPSPEQHCCEEMTSTLQEGEVAIVYWEKFREYGIQLSSEFSSAVQIIKYCPWCGQLLPADLRIEWFERLDALGLEPDDPAVPEEMRTDAWWKNQDRDPSGDTAG